MPIADSKKAQTIRNLLHTEVGAQIVRANDVAEALRAAIVANNLAGEFPAAQRTALQAMVNDLATFHANHAATFAALAATHASTHGNKTMTIAGVND